MSYRIRLRPMYRSMKVFMRILEGRFKTGKFRIRIWGSWFWNWRMRLTGRVG
jgi:hypothetical protein